jgi:hypothetical protein
MVLSSIKDFVIPTLQTIESLGSRASPDEVENEFYKRFAMNLDPLKDWNKITPNHNKQLWRDYCGSRVVYHYLKPNGYITIERHGNKGSIWELTKLGRMELQNRRAT